MISKTSISKYTGAKLPVLSWIIYYSISEICVDRTATICYSAAVAKNENTNKIFEKIGCYVSVSD